MRRSYVFLCGVFAVTATFGRLGINEGKTVRSYAAAREAYIGGMPAGFTLSAGGVQVIGICDVIEKEGTSVSPASLAGIRSGDVIVKAAGIDTDSVAKLNELLSASGGKEMLFTIKRGNNTQDVRIQPKKDKNDKYKIGVMIRDSISGVGTVTYIDKATRRFGALGHAVVDEDRKEMKISENKVYQCSIVGVTKGVRGRAGELRGMFLMNDGVGEADKLCESGIYGTISVKYDLSGLQAFPVGEIDEVKPGGAYIYSTVSGVLPKKYTVDIVKVDKNNKQNKNFVVKITDKDLIEETGGIVQGMSGSPIVQNDKIVGAITHVFLNDPTRGYGIDVNTMMKE